VTQIGLWPATGEEARQAGLATVQRHLATLNALLDACAAMQHRTSLLLPGATAEAGAHAWETQSLIAESIDGMVEDVHYEDAAEDFSNSPGSSQLHSMLLLVTMSCLERLQFTHF
jgi:hypothetical protein